MLLDLNVWFASVWQEHKHYAEVSSWFDEQDGELRLCRVTQMGLLRLLSNQSVMGDAALSRAEAWRLLDELRSDERVVWTSEPANLEQVWRVISAREDRSHKLWTDDYLAAFAQALACPLVTLDRGFVARYPSVAVVTLGDGS
ncbi:hypothetical protein GCM10009676_35880 [Prauserella halophila]|uniref:Ribonuclease VapC n=1 Tax=Prauserella halophila TaxID=185641 RepID=A0ABP4H0S0_9PSEU|nr:TA system VapC family ribonuclease toxin [Prauserella halophila]MCP2238303.1 hypothetical protein [Prauserella halophila]